MKHCYIGMTNSYSVDFDDCFVGSGLLQFDVFDCWLPARASRHNCTCFAIHCRTFNVPGAERCLYPCYV